MTDSCTIIIVAGQHGDEPEGLLVAHALRMAARVILGSSRHVKFYGMLNPEGFARARRHRDDDADPNRVWGRPDESPIQAKIRAEILAARSIGDVAVVDCHSSHRTEHVLYAGPTTLSLAQLVPAQRHEDRDEGSLTAWCEDHRIPCITAEAQRGHGVETLVDALAAGLRAWSVPAAA